jgi:orotidine-5'-phosphate decarboxylase
MSAILKYRQRAEAENSLVCVGLDSDPAKIPARFGGDVVAFNQWIIEKTHSFACAYKPNIAFYEARGAEGWRDVQQTVDYLRANHPDIFVICDAKRSDNSTSNAGYVKAMFDQLGCDAVTLHPYMGRQSLAPFLQRQDKGCIILCRTSNPGDDELQNLLVDGKPFWKIVAEKVRDEWNANGNCMLVVGATHPQELAQVRQIVGDMPLLVPGVGAQGGDVEAATRAGMDSGRGGLIINASRSIIYADSPAAAAQQLRDEINAARSNG